MRMCPFPATEKPRIAEKEQRLFDLIEEMRELLKKGDGDE